MASTSFLRLPQVKTKTGLSASSIYARMALSQFPKPITLGPHAVAWIDSEVEAWIQAHIRASRGEVNETAAAHEAVTP